MKSPFFGRETEMNRLKKLLNKRSSSLVVLRGRRRIGKSRLAQEFGNGLNTYTLIGLPPEETPDFTAQTEREEFAKQMEREIGVRGLRGDDWGDLFWHLSKAVSKGRHLVILDEINWMGSKDPTFLGKLKTAWDMYFSKNPQLIIILSGSMSGWIEKNILSSTGFLGRVSLDIVLDELPLHECVEFWGKKKNLISDFEKFKVLSVTGGVPKYLEEIDPSVSAEENIQTLAFQKGGLLFEEFEHIFSDLFSRKAETYKKIVTRLASGPTDLNGIIKHLGIEKSGTISNYLDDLEETGYVSRDYTWNIKSGEESKLSQFRLKDNYLRFYLKYIEPNKNKINKEGCISPPSWHTIMGLQFENLVLNNRQALYKTLNINPKEVLVANPYFQKETTKHASCQIDFMIQTKFKTIYVVEVKFSQEEIGSNIISEMKEKITKLTSWRSFSIRPVLIHVNGIKPSVESSDFFSNIIDFGALCL